MPAIMDDPEAPTIYRVSGEPPFPDPNNLSLPETIVPRQVTLRDRQTVATVVPFASRTQVPPSLLLYLSDQFKKEVEGGDTYPMIDPMPFEKFASYWFQNFGAIMLLGSIDSADEVVEGKDWSKECLGSFYIKPNYPGRSSHVCNAGFLVTDASRNRGVGRLMGETYLDWAPKLGYTYSVFNLVYETNVASCKIWDALGFKRIGRVKGCGNLKSYPGRFIDAIIYGRDLVLGESEELVSEERFDKIKFYLKYGKYPNGADRAEKSRLRSAATHYKLLDNDKLMLKGKEVISDPQRQDEIARQVHLHYQHAGINKTTSTLAERYHWSGIKETVNNVIKKCAECKELGKTPLPGGNSVVKGRPSSNNTNAFSSTTTGPGPGPGPGAASVVPDVDTSMISSSSAGPRDNSVTEVARRVPLQDSAADPRVKQRHPADLFGVVTPVTYAELEPMTVMSPGQTLHTPTDSPIPPHAALPGHNPMLQDQSHGLGGPPHHPHHHHSPHSAPRSALPLTDPHGADVYQPIDPQIISQPSPHGHHHHHHHHHHQVHQVHHHHDPFEPFHHAHHSVADTDTFQALLNATDDVVVGGGGHGVAASHDPHRDDLAADAADREAMDRDLDMLIDPQDDDDDEDDDGDGGGGGGTGGGGRDGDEEPGPDDMVLGSDAARAAELNNDSSKMDIGSLVSADEPRWQQRWGSRVKPE